jgi:basic amino acid/polyamine antiporter, APA family
MRMTATRAQPQMMGPWLTTALVIGAMIGSGIFMLPASLAPLGWNAVAAWFVSLVGALSIAFALSRLSRGGGGGIQSYIEQAFGRLVGFLVTWAFWVANWASMAALAIAFGAAMSRIWPLFGDDTVVVLAVTALVVLTLVNAMGVRASGGLNILTIAIKLMPLVGVVVLLGVAVAAGEPLQPLARAPLTIASIAAATTLTLFALLGFENATAPVGKVRDPERTLPRAIIGGTLLVGIIYLLSSSAVTLLLPAELVAASPAPYADAFAARGGEELVRFAAFAIAISAFGALNCATLVGGELGYAMAIRRQLPATMARTRATNTPVVAQATSAALAILLVLANASRSTAELFTFVILLTTSATLIVYLAGTAAALPACRSIGSRAILAVAAAFIFFAFYGAGLEANGWCLVLLGVGAAFYAGMRSLSSRSASPPAEAVPAALRG